MSELELLKSNVLELAAAFGESADNPAFNEGYRDGCRVASRDFGALIEFWDEIRDFSEEES